jgi:phosphate:Na+ symporter
MSVSHIDIVFRFIGGLGMFLYGMNVMVDGLQKLAGNKTKQLLSTLTSNQFLAVILGVFITAMIQSSSATSVLVVGFVDAGILSLTQAAGVIMGANIGTTATSWMVAMSEWGTGLNPEGMAPLIIGIGAFAMLFSKKAKTKMAGEIAVGFGILFIGLSFMTDSVTPYKNAPIILQAFRILGKNPILGIMTGAIVTAVIQSSSASIGILQTLALKGMVDWQSAIFITLGQNIGTCITTILSSAGAQMAAKRAAAIHLLFNVIGAVTFAFLIVFIFALTPEFAKSKISSVQISLFHTIFNVSNTILLFPFTKQIVRLSEIIIKKSTNEVN